MAEYCPAKSGPALYTECLECDDRAACKGSAGKAEEKPVRIIIAGSRGFADYHLLRRVMSESAGNIRRDLIEIVSGGAAGADRLGEMFAERNSLKLTRFPANWEQHGKAAGPIRNRQMAEYAGAGGVLIAFWDEKSRGTKNMIDTAMNLGLFLRVVSIAPERYGKTIAVE